MRCRVLVATAFACVFLVGSAHATGAQDGGDQEHGRRISVTGGLVVAQGETIDGPAVSANGPMRIDGRVNGDRPTAPDDVVTPVKRRFDRRSIRTAP